MARLLVDVSPLRESRDFRLLFSGQLVSMFGSQLTIVAIAWQTYLITHSSFWVGLVSLFQLPFLLFGSLWGGAVGDRVDRRNLLTITAVVLGSLSAAMALNVELVHSSLALMIVLAVGASGVTGFHNPARNAAIPRLVRPEQLVGAYSINQVVIQMASIVGPALAGVFLASGGTHMDKHHVVTLSSQVAGLSACYWIDAASFLAVAVATSMMNPLRPTGNPTASAWRATREGFVYVRGHISAQCVYLVDLNAMIFGMPNALFPALALHRYHGGAITLGLLYAAPAAGALLGAVSTGWVERVRRRGRAVVLAVSLWGLAITIFGFTPSLFIGVAALALAGWADVISAVLRNTILQSTITDEFRGRLSAIQMAVVQGGPRLGNFEAGAVASLTSLEFSVVSGGVACVVGALALAGWRPSFWRDTADL